MESNIDNDSDPVPVSTPNKDDFSEQETNWTIFYMLVILVEVLSLVALVLVVILTKDHLGGYAWDGSGKMFNWHPVLMVLGLVILYGNAAISYRVFRNSPKFTIKLVHAGLQFLALIFVIIGLIAVFGFHNHNKIPNMYSLHSWIGMATVLMFCMQYVLGFLGFLYPKFSDSQRATYLGLHVFFGVAILAMAVVACVSGLTEKMLFSSKLFTYSNFPAAGNIANTLGLAITAIAVTVGYIVYNPSYKRQEQYENIQ